MDKKFINVPEDPAEKKKFITVFISAVAGLVVFAVIIGSLLGVISNKTANKKEPDTTQPIAAQDTTTPAPVETTQPAAPYAEGYYIVQYESRLRTKNVYYASNNIVTKIPAQTVVYIDAVFETEDPEHVWWGLIERYTPNENVPDLYYTGYIWMEGLIPKAEQPTEPAVTSATSTGVYTQPGDYATKVGLRLRTGAGITFDALTTVPEGTSLTVTEVSDAGEQASEEERYWGKTTYNGNTGYVAMYYLTKNYSSSIITPSVEETTIEVTDTSIYAPGTYTATAIIKVRTSTDASQDTNLLGTFAEDDKVEITKIVQTSKTVDALKYWGVITYQGQTAYVSMAYLEKA